MRKLKLQVQLSVDGYIAGPNGEMDFLVRHWDSELKRYVAEITEPVDCIVLGRKLAQGFIPHWASNPKEEGADKFNRVPKVVFTKTLNKSEWSNTVLAKGELVAEITTLKKQSALIKQGLIDEFHKSLRRKPLASAGGGSRLLLS